MAGCLKLKNEDISVNFWDKKLILFLFESFLPVFLNYQLIFYITAPLRYKLFKNVPISSARICFESISVIWAASAGMWAVIKVRPVHKTSNAYISAIFKARELILFLLESSCYSLSDEITILHIFCHFLWRLFNLAILSSRFKIIFLSVGCCVS